MPPKLKSESVNSSKPTCTGKHQLSRRSFFGKATRFAAGAIAFPAIVPSRALGRDGATAPSNRIVMGCIGVGGQGTRHVVGGIWTPAGGLVGRDDVQVVALCDVNAHNLASTLAQVHQRY